MSNTLNRPKVEGDRRKLVNKSMSKFISPSPLPKKKRFKNYRKEIPKKTIQPKSSKSLNNLKLYTSLNLKRSKNLNKSDSDSQFFKNQILELRRKQLKLIQSFHREKKLYLQESKRQSKKIMKLENILSQHQDPSVSSEDIFSRNRSLPFSSSSSPHSVVPEKEKQLDLYEKRLKELETSLHEKSMVLKKFDQQQRDLDRSGVVNFNERHPLIQEYNRSFRDMEKKFKSKIDKKENELTRLQTKYDSSLSCLRDYESKNEKNEILKKKYLRRIKDLEESNQRNEKDQDRKENEFLEYQKQLENNHEKELQELMMESEEKIRKLEQSKNINITKLENRNRRLQSQLQQVTLDKETQLNRFRKKIEKLTNYEQFEEISEDVILANNEIKDIRNIILQSLQDHNNTSIDDSYDDKNGEEREYRLLSPRGVADEEKSSNEIEKNVFKNLAILKKEIQILKSKIMEVYASSLSSGSDCTIQ